MRSASLLCVSIVFVNILVSQKAFAQQPVITSYHGNGQLTWTNPPGANAFRIEWAATLLGSNIWKQDWRDLVHVETTTTVNTVTVPMFYRVVQETNTQTNATAWITAAVPEGGVYFLLGADGSIPDAIGITTPYPGAPYGYYQLFEDGYLCIIAADRSPYAICAQLTNQTQGVLQYPSFVRGADMFKVSNPDLCQGTWTGTLYRTTPTSATNGISIDVIGSGTITSVGGLTGPFYGHMFALSTNNGTAAVWFRTGELSTYSQVMMGGVVSNNTFTGNFRAIEPTMEGSVTLIRQ